MFRKTILFIIILSIAAISAYAEEEQKEKRDRIQYIGNLVIDAGEVIEGDVIVMQGDLSIAGLVNGDAIVSLGDAFVDSGGVVKGDLVTWKGKIYVDPDGYVEGKQVEQRLLDLPFRKENFQVGSSVYEDNEYDDEYDYDEDRDEFEFEYKFEYDDESHNEFLGPVLSYNKVDGFFLGMEIPKVISSNVPNVINIHGYGGYGFSNDRWQYYAELDKEFFRRNRFEIGFEGHKLTDTEDNWIIGNYENSLAAFLIHEDFRDYFYRTGYGAHIGMKLPLGMRLKVKYLNDQYDAEDNNTNWALFGNKKDFLPNFGFLGAGANIIEGNMRSVIAEGSLKMFDGDLFLSGSYEKAGDDFNGDFNFTRYIFEMKGRMGFTDNEAIVYRLKFGGSENGLPPQKAFTLGGLSTLRGFTHKEFVGEQMALLNLEYRVFGRKHSDYWWYLKHMQLCLFTDIGSVNNKIFSDFDTDYYKSDVGFAFIDNDDEWRLNFARRTDTGDKPWVVTFRITRPF